MTDSLEAAIDKFGADALGAIDDYKAKLAEAADTIARLRERVAELEATSDALSRAHQAAEAELSSLKAAGTRADGIEAAATAASFAAWKHEGEDAYSQGMDAGARHQVKACVEAIRALSPASPKPVVGNGEAHEAIVAAIDFLDAEHLRRRDIGPGEDEDHIAEPERIASRLHALLPSLTAAELDAKRASRFGREGG